MGSTVTVAVAGATGAIGREIVTVLDRVRWRPATLLAAASPTSVTPFVDYGDERVPVEDVAHLDLAACDAIFLALPAEPARALAGRAQAEGVAVIDVSGTLARDGDVPLVIPWVNPEQLGAIGPRRAVATPSAEAQLLAALLGPLVRAGLGGTVSATLLVPASSAGRAGIDELSRQVTALFNAGTPPRRVFPHGLAFDLLPAMGEPLDDGVTARERAIADEVRRLVGDGFDLSIGVVGAPVFSGLSADVSLRLSRRTPPDLVARILADGGVRFAAEAGARFLPRPRRIEGEAFAHAGRVRAVGDDGAGVRLFAALDNLRGTATCAVGVAAALLRDRLRDEG
jgi:aspartate-semialdehyde dehydrogenase